MILLDFSKKVDTDNIPETEEWQQNIKIFLREWFSDSQCIITKTSGSTGSPKEIKQSKEAMMKSADMTGRFLNLKEEDTALLCMPSQYIAGKMMLVRAIVWKLKLHCIKPGSHPLENINESFVFSAMTPMQVENSIDKLHLIKKLIIGGAQVPVLLVEKIKNLTTEIYESFGMTETISHIALKQLSNTENQYFKVMPYTKIWKDSRGCLCIKPIFLTEDISTNDLVNIISDTQFEWLGRIDNVINSGGIKIFPEQVEKQLKTFIDNEFIITHEKDSILGDKVILVIEGDKDEVLENKINNFNYENKYEKPREIIYIKRFNRTPTGKIIRKI